MLSLLLELAFQTRAEADDVEYNKSYGRWLSRINSAEFIDLFICERFIDIIYQAQMWKIFWCQLLECEDWLLYSVLYHLNCIRLGFGLFVGQNKLFEDANLSSKKS